MTFFHTTKILFKLRLVALGLLGLPFLSNTTLAETYQIQDFSDDYHAVIQTSADEDSEASTTINIIDAKTKQTLISQPTDIDIAYELSNSEEYQRGNKVSANIANRYYGEHSVLIYGDFNFDDQKDLALQDGRYGCYGGPSYQVYLKQGDTFVLSDSFTELAQGYCGFFGIDKESKTLNTMTKSGAAWHQFKEFKVINNKPVAVRIIEEEYNSRGLISIKESTRVNGKMEVEDYEMLAPYVEQAEDPLIYIYMLTLDNDKQMVLNSQYKNGGEELYYAFADEEGTVELLYEGAFIYDKKQKTLSFTNRPVVYQVNDKGITVKLPNQTVQLKAQPERVQGNLDEVTHFKNVRVR